MKRYLLPAIFIALIGGAAFFAYRTFKHQYSPAQDAQKTTTSQDQILQVENANQATNQDNSATNDASTTPTDNTATDSASDVPTQVNDKNDTTGSMLAHITTEHCDSDCKAFGDDLSLLEYCEQVCGIAPIKNVKNCDDKKDIEKDYCLKDLAINKKDSAGCAGIIDVNIRQTCQNRIMQDVFESQ